MQMMASQAELGRFMLRANTAIIRAAASRRQRHDRASLGDRAPAALGQAPVVLRQLTDRTPEGKPNQITLDGHSTAVRALPRVLQKLADTDPRRRAAMALADTAERIGAVRGMSMEGTDTKGGQSDGGATTRVKHAARLRAIEALANGWMVDRRRHRIVKGPQKVLMPVQRSGGKRKEITAFTALQAVCVDSLSLDHVLRQHGWSAQTKTRRQLADAVLACLDDVADGLGFGRWNKSVRDESD